MKYQNALGFKLFAANPTLVSGVWMLWSWQLRSSDAALSMRGVTGRADSCLVAPRLEQKNLIAEH